MRFMATARVSWVSFEMEPKLMAPVQNRLTISEAGSTESRGDRPPLPFRGRERVAAYPPPGEVLAVRRG